MKTTTALRGLVAYCADRLEASSQLALLASRGREPLCGAEFLLDTLEDLTPELHALRRALRLARK